MFRSLLCFISVLVLAISTSLKAYAQGQQEEMQMKSTDYMHFYDLIDGNITYYNHINDSLFGEYTKDEWVETYLRRARITSQIGQDNQAIINFYKPFFKNDTLTASFLESLNNDSLDIVPKLMDDFLNEELLEYLLQKEEKLLANGVHVEDDILNTKLALAISKYFASSSGDDQARVESIRLFKDILDNMRPGRDIELTPSSASNYIRAGSNLNNLTNLVYLGVISADEMNSYRDMLAEVVNDTVFCRGVSKSIIQTAQSIVANQPAAMLRNVYIPDTTHRYDAIRDKMMAVYVDTYDHHPEKEAKLSLANKRRLTLMRQRIGRISVLEALEESSRLVDSLSVKLETEVELKNKFSCVLECIYYIDLSDFSFEAKHEKIKAYCDEMLIDLANFHYVNKMPQLVTALSNIASYPRIHKYLYPEERKEFLKEVLFFSQPFTRAHSETVTHLAMTILQSVIDHEPELLIGLMGNKTRKEVKKHQKELKTFFYDGALFHDLGKTHMPDIIRNEYRQLNDHEFSIIRRHPELGLEYLNVDSSLMLLHDFVLGHHKWYDGKGGYPAYFDNTKSPYRVLIDILTLSDCLEAATARLGRNYRKNKHYGDVIKEFQADAGTRYNPYLVKHIETHPKLARQLEEICEKGWEEIYYNIFSSHSKQISK